MQYAQDRIVGLHELATTYPVSFFKSTADELTRKFKKSPCDIKKIGKLIVHNYIIKFTIPGNYSMLLAFDCVM
jgi:hypothetical protein